MVTYPVAIGKFKNKGLEELFHDGKTKRITKTHHKRILMILDFLNAIGDISDCYGHFGHHPLHGKRKGEYGMNVSGNYRICFKWDGRDVYDLVYEDYH